MNAVDAEEFTQALEAVLEGNAMSLSGAWRLRADAIKRDVPKALGMTRREWVDRLAERFGRYRITDDHRAEVVKLLDEEGMSNRAIGDALGVDHKTIAADLGGGENSPPDDDDSRSDNESADEGGENSPPDGDDDPARHGTNVPLTDDDLLIGSADPAGDEDEDDEPEPEDPAGPVAPARKTRVALPEVMEDHDEAWTECRSRFAAGDIAAALESALLAGRALGRVIRTLDGMSTETGG